MDASNLRLFWHWHFSANFNENFFQMILLTNDDFYALQLCFSSFFDWRDPKSTNCKKLDFKTFLEKMRFFAICGFEKIDQKQSRRSLRSSLHNELSPFIHEVKLVSPPFWGSTLFVSIPLGIINANAKKKCEKVC